MSTEIYSCSNNIINNTNNIQNLNDTVTDDFGVPLNQFGRIGMMYGLYKPDGPLSVYPHNKCCGNQSFLTSIVCTANTVLNMTFNYTDTTIIRNVKLEIGNIYTIDYLDNGNVIRISGKITSIDKIYTQRPSLCESANNNITSDVYNIAIDASSNYATNKIIISSDQIRNAVAFIPYAEEDTTILNSEHDYGTTVGLIENAIITNATIDSANHIVEGTIINGDISDGTTCDGLAFGVNSSGHNITTIYGTTIKGHISTGYMLSGNLRSGSTEGGTGQDGMMVGVTIKGTVSDVVIINTTVIGGKTTNGKVIDPTIYGSTVIGAIITGDDIVTTNGITIGDITTGGISVGGTGTGGSASGTIENRLFNIENGITKPSINSELSTVGGIVTGGQIIGGVKVGNAIMGAVIKGGTVTQGTTTGGDTSNGKLIPVANNITPISKNINTQTNMPNVNGPGYPPNTDMYIDNSKLFVGTSIVNGTFTNLKDYKPK